MSFHSPLTAIRDHDWRTDVNALKITRKNFVHNAKNATKNARSNGKLTRIVDKIRGKVSEISIIKNVTSYIISTAIRIREIIRTTLSAFSLTTFQENLARENFTRSWRANHTSALINHYKGIGIRFSSWIVIFRGINHRPVRIDPNWSRIVKNFSSIANLSSNTRITRRNAQPLSPLPATPDDDNDKEDRSQKIRRAMYAQAWNSEIIRLAREPQRRRVDDENKVRRGRFNAVAPTDFSRVEAAYLCVNTNLL